MAFKALYGFCGELEQVLTTVAGGIVLDDDSMATLRYALNGGSNYTYLIALAPTYYEVLLTQAFVGNTVNVARAQDGTTASTFPVGTQIKFCMGDAAIAAMINERALGQVSITGSGMVTVTQVSQNEFNISAPPVSIVSESDNILVGGGFPNFVLSTPTINGCCD